MGSHAELLKLQRNYAALWQQQSDQSLPVLQSVGGGLRP
jgi:hypothetical protein